MGLFGSLGRAIGGLFGFGGQPQQELPPQKPYGGDGVISYGGFLPSPEQNPALTGQQKWITFANAVNMAIVATGVRYRCDLLAGTKWSATPNEAGGEGAQRGVELVERGLLKARLDQPWGNVVRKASLYKLFGFSLHEWSADRIGAGGEWAFTEIAHRPQSTVDRWDKPSEQAPWSAIGQMTQAGNRYVVPRNRLFYCVDNLLTESPDGVGLMRHVVQLVHQLVTLEGIEGFGYETDVRGTPIGRAPFAAMLQELGAQAGKPLTAEIQAEINARTQQIRGFLQNLIKSPDKLQYLFLDSGTYQGADPNNITSIPKWGVDLLQGAGAGLAEIDSAIRRKQLEIARVLGIEFAMMGADGAGSYALSADKTTLFATSLQTTLTELAAFATRDLAAPLVGLAGLDVATCCPTLVAQPISTEAVEATCRALQLLGMAALQPGDPARDIIRERLHLPPEPAPAPEAMGVGLGPGPGGPEGGELGPDGQPIGGAEGVPGETGAEDLGAQPVEGELPPSGGDGAPPTDDEAGPPVPDETDDQAAPGEPTEATDDTEQPPEDAEGEQLDLFADEDSAEPTEDDEEPALEMPEGLSDDDLAALEEQDADDADTEWNDEEPTEDETADEEPEEGVDQDVDNEPEETNDETDDETDDAEPSRRARKALTAGGGIKGEFDESKHPRANDGRFGSGPGHAAAPGAKKPAGKKPGAAGKKPTAGAQTAAADGAKAPPAKPAAVNPAKKPAAGKGKPFNAKPHEKVIARHAAAEVKHREASIKVKAQMAELKAKAKNATPKQKAAIKAKFEKLKAKREALQGKANEAKAARLDAKKTMLAAAKEHKAKQKELAVGNRPGAKKPKAPKPASESGDTNDHADAKPISEKDYHGWREGSIDKPPPDPKAVKAMSVYSGEHYTAINTAFRKDEELPDRYKDVAANLDSAIAKAKAPKSIQVYRGMSGKQFFGHLKPGDVFTDKAYMSTTIDPDVTEDFVDDFDPSNSAIFHITLPKGANALPMTKHGDFPKEKEVLLPRGTSLRVSKVEKHETGATIFHVTVVTAKPKKTKA